MAAKKNRKGVDPHGFRQEGRDLLRGIAGGSIVGAPLLYTMEVWFNGGSFHSAHLLIAMLVILALNIGFSYFAGLRERHLRASVRGAVFDALTALGLAIFVAAGILALIGRIDFTYHGIGAIAGKVLLEACVVSVGITFTNYKFQEQVDERTGSRLDDGKGPADGRSNEQKQVHADLADLAAALTGSFVFAFNIAPTEEIVLIASGLSPLSLLALLVAGMVLAYVILYAAGFRDHAVYEKESLFQAPTVETMMTYAAALFVSALLLLLFGPADAVAAPYIFTACVIALAFPAVVGAAAGRLIV